MKRRADLVADLGEEVGLPGARLHRRVATGREPPLGLAFAGQVAPQGAKSRCLGRPDPRDRQRQGQGDAGPAAPDDLQGSGRRLGLARAAQGFEPGGHLGVAVRLKQHQDAFPGDLLLVVAEQPFARRIHRHDPPRRIEDYGSVGREVQHLL